MPGFFYVQASVMVVLVAAVVTMVGIVTMTVRTVVVPVITATTMIADDATAQGSDGRQNHGDEK